MSSVFPLERLSREFEFIKQVSYRGIQGVYRIDSNNPGPILGITLHTHGNEPSGLAVSSYLRSNFNLQEKLSAGSVIFVLNNLLATQKYFEACTASDEQGKRDARWIDQNMNRLPPDTMHRVGDNQYEIRRAQKLLPIWSLFDVGLDIHSMTQRADPMIISIGTLHKKLITGFPIEIIVSNIGNVQIGKPVVSFYGSPDHQTAVLGIETGFHEDELSFERGIKCAQSIMQNLGMLVGEAVPVSANYVEYCVVDSIWFPDSSYELVRIFKTYESIAKGEVLARGGGKDICASIDGHVLFAPDKMKPDSIKEEVMFISQPKRTFVI